MNVRDLVFQLEKFKPDLEVRVSTDMMEDGSSFPLSWVLEMVDDDYNDEEDNIDDVLYPDKWIELGGRRRMD